MTISKELKDMVENSPVISRNGFPYVRCSLTDGTPSINPSLLKEACEGMIEIGDFDCNIILAPEAMGIPYATIISQITGIPFSVIRKRRSFCDDEIEVIEKTGYDSVPMYINGVRKGNRVVIVDDIVDTGGSIKAFVEGLRKIDCKIVSVITLINKSDDLPAISNDIGIEVKSLISIKVINGKVHVVDE